VNGLVKSLRYELRGTGVRVWAACPGRTESEFYRRALTAGEPLAVTGPIPRADPTDRVVRAIVKGLDGRRTFLVPSAASATLVGLAHWLPRPFDWWMERWAPGHFRREISAARGDPNPSAP
jgi:short-subunit dehydrogenase